MLMRCPCLVLLVQSSSPIMMRGFSARFTGPLAACLFFLLGGRGLLAAAAAAAGDDVLSVSSSPNCVSPLMLLTSQTRIVQSCDPVYSLPPTTWSTNTTPTPNHRKVQVHSFSKYHIYDASVLLEHS